MKKHLKNGGHNKTSSPEKLHKLAKWSGNGRETQGKYKWMLLYASGCFQKDLLKRRPVQVCHFNEKGMFLDLWFIISFMNSLFCLKTKKQFYRKHKNTSKLTTGVLSYVNQWLQILINCFSRIFFNISWKMILKCVSTILQLKNDFIFCIQLRKMY